MSRVVVRTAVPVVAADAVAVLASKPTRWLRPFLQLAVASTPCHVLSDPTGLWYRLGPGEEGDGVWSAPLVWWPHAGDRLFRRFVGAITVRESATDTVLELAGEMEDGEESCNVSAVNALVKALAAAFGAQGRLS